VEETRLLSVEELSLHEFLLDQILFLQELLELSLLPRIINELLGRELVAPPPSFKDIPSPPRVEGRVAERCSVAVCTPGPLLAGASVLVVRDPTEAHVLLPSSQALETRSSFVQFAMTQCFQYAMCHGKVVMSFKARSPEFVALGLGSAVPPPPHHGQPAHLVAKGYGGSNSPRMLVPHHRLPSLKLSMWCLDHRWSCSHIPYTALPLDLLLPFDVSGCQAAPFGLPRARW
jgi:hypothetical protein